MKLIVAALVLAGIFDIAIVVFGYDRFNYKFVFIVYIALLSVGGYICFSLRHRFQFYFNKIKSDTDDIKKIKDDGYRLSSLGVLSKTWEVRFIYFYIAAVVLLIIPGILTSIVGIILALFNLYVKHKTDA